MPDRGATRAARAEARNRPGELALSFGIIALVFSFLPTLGELVAAPAALLAIVLGLIGARLSERGAATNLGRSLAGVTLGIVALLIVVLVFAVTLGPVR
ncbi:MULTISPECIES: hypothetical protein [Streptomyces]|uniref:hypothetical protein n=1 Tax=Streptomyces TaxID=1883 RepID=UPI001C615D8E|nr:MULTISPECIES: hypothetical protein [Streptomyces]